MARTWLRKIHGERIVFTGRAWLSRRELNRLVRRKGGIPAARVTNSVTVLVRGDSSVWAFGDYGIKERQAAQLIRQGASISLIHDAEFRKLLEGGRPARVVDRIAGEPVQWLTTPTRRQFERAASIEGPLDREHTAFGRVEQSYLRHALFQDGDMAACSLCGRHLPISLLVAAHIKPRSECSRRERLDVENIVTGMCLLGCDALYERGLLGVDEKGRILRSRAHNSPAIAAVLRGFRRRTCATWNPVRAQYFNWHRLGRFQAG